MQTYMKKQIFPSALNEKTFFHITKDKYFDNMLFFVKFARQLISIVFVEK